MFCWQLPPHKVLFYAAILFLPLLFLPGCKTRTISTHAEISSITESVYASGVVKSAGQYQVYANVAGVIDKIFVKEGDTVKKGQKLASIANRALISNTESSKITADFNALENNRAKLSMLQQNIDFARERLENEEMMLERQENLWAQGIGTRAELDQRRLSAKNAATQYQHAQLQLEDSRKQLNYAAAQSRASQRTTIYQAKDLTITSNTAGSVFTLFKKEGEMILPQTPFAIVGNNESFYLELQVDEFDIARISEGLKVIVTMDSYKGQAYEATVSRVIPFMNERSKTFTVEARFDIAPGKLYPNLTAEANIITGTKSNALLIPREYLVDDSLVVTADGKNRKVVTGARDYEKVEILYGLSKNEEILMPKK